MGKIVVYIHDIVLCIIIIVSLSETEQSNDHTVQHELDQLVKTWCGLLSRVQLKYRHCISQNTIGI